MYEFMAVTDIRPEELTRVCRDHQTDGYSVEQIDHRTRMTGLPISAEQTTIYDIIFKRTTPEQSHGQFLINRAYGKLREVRDALVPIMDVMDDDGRKGAVGRVVADIDKFLFDGSPDDM